METIFKILVVIILVFLANRFMSSNRKVNAEAIVAKAAAVAAAKIAKGGNANGFFPVPSPFAPPPDRLLILAPPHCPSAEGQRADALVRGLNNDGIACSRSGNISIKPSGPPSEAEWASLNEIMLGEVPVVFVNGRVANNPTLAEVEAEYGVPGR